MSSCIKNGILNSPIRRKRLHTPGAYLLVSAQMEDRVRLLRYSGNHPKPRQWAAHHPQHILDVLSMPGMLLACVQTKEIAVPITVATAILEIHQRIHMISLHVNIILSMKEKLPYLQGSFLLVKCRVPGLCMGSVICR